MKKVAFYTLGCKVNQYETEAMEELFEKSGYKVVGEDEVADVYVINTCTVTNLGDRKSRQFIRRAKKLNIDSIIAVVGCYSQVAPDEIEKMEDVDVIIGTGDKKDIVKYCEEAKEQKKRINIVKDFRELKVFEELKIEEIKSRTRAYMKIQEGCNQFCSYCIIPYARGPIRSRDFENIIDEAKRLSKAGFKEIILTGIHVASYGKDLKDIGLLDVIEGINKVEGIERIRLSSMEPTLIDENFMKTVSSMPKFCDHFHLSLQSGSDTILKKMNRKYTTKEYSEIVDLIRKYMPNAGITTDIIVGFPGEGESEFDETLDFVNKIRFSRIHVFKYSPRKGTPASKFKDQVHGSIKNERSEKLIKVGEKLMEDFNQQLLGKTLEVLFEEESKENPEYIEGYTTNYVRIKTLGDEKLKGNIFPVKMTKLDGENLIGKIEEF
ncbi:tRNA (N(6)-L-threonylcarbamoyladenosine(37)-C(2))-methylthiotransferase MtaB [Anaerosalibacter sp. Marseille-P3206]|uniref:tRNA (N(6)-L-threonylcarbamoyladenosine(37)-C(2))- methylthiotransferase MtaB n=1 Tax=Anaerosalibacter sp. Marseille-P3206 TaxID=1871005 RepID=UPI00098429BB|nr:tRNA (N(6)-L-threonylcarbamoyladenosine(37)-C(2))-methylthiotransferase MtaB [Anaerosalibacter sp. Marseille-P3206]